MVERRDGLGAEDDPWRAAADAALGAQSPWESDGFARLYQLALREGRRALRRFRALDAARCDDLAAETITRTLRRVAAADAPRGYFRTAVQRAALSWLRCDRAAVAEAEAPRYVEGPLDEAEARAVYALDARAALAEMSARDRAVLVADACGASRESIARRWSTSRANVDQIVSRARRHARPGAR